MVSYKKLAISNLDLVFFLISSSLYFRLVKVEGRKLGKTIKITGKRSSMKGTTKIMTNGTMRKISPNVRDNYRLSRLSGKIYCSNGHINNLIKNNLNLSIEQGLKFARDEGILLLCSLHVNVVDKCFLSKRDFTIYYYYRYLSPLTTSIFLHYTSNFYILTD